MLRYGFVPSHREGEHPRDRRVGSHGPADDRRAGGPAGHDDQGHRRHAVGHSGDPQEERELDAGARGGDRELPAAAASRRRFGRRAADRRQADGGLEPGHPARRHDDLHGDPAAGERHPHRNGRRRGPREVPGRRGAPVRDAADRSALPQHDHLAREGHGGARHRREARAPGRALQAPPAGQDDRLPRLDHAERPRRGRGHPYSRQGIDQRAVPRAAPRHSRVPRAGAEALPEVHRRAVRHGARDRPDGQRQDDDALCGALGDQDDRGQDRDDRGPGRVPAPRHYADSDQREEGPDVRARTAVDPAARPRQDHGRRDPRPRNGADRHPVGADRAPRLHHGSRQQRARRAGPVPEHGRRSLPVRRRRSTACWRSGWCGTSACTASGRRR